MKSKVSIVRCDDYTLDNIRSAVHKSFAQLGGLEKFVKKDQRVLIKPNLLSAKDPSRAITTHPALVQAVIEEVKRMGATPILGDSPGGVERGIKRVWENTKMSEVAGATGAKLVAFESGGVYERKTEKGKKYFIAKPLLDADVIISLPKLKTHTLTLMTCAVKNMFGSIPGFRKSEYHRDAPKPGDFARVIVDIFSLTKPNISLVDAVVCMEGDGPSSGNPKYLGLLLASTDAVALDMVAAKIMGFKDGEIDITSAAQEKGLGARSFSEMEILGENSADLSAPKFILPSNRFLKLIPKFLLAPLRPLVWVRPGILDGNCTNCNICVDNCPTNTIRKGEKIPYFDYTDCINCMCCHELCPQKAVFLKKSWLAKKIA
ncbi:MAG: hypothetical protein AMJ73_06590 [candidate division Zixibacteria bacterium SM1_73]|nr:MAG: hypothetical protein AMJ73_06590 [candidate division Zixibacteria bacterium SM1_73]